MISTRDLFLAYVLAKLCGVVAAFLLFGADADSDLLVSVAHIGSFLVLIALISITSKRSPLDLLREQPYRGVWRGKWWYWAFAAVSIGFFIRFGAVGTVLFVKGMVDPELPYREFSEYLAEPKRDLSSLYAWLMLLAFFSIGAAEEEFTYRKILMPGISRSIGLPWGFFTVALIFGLMHNASSTAFIAGMSFALLYILSGRLMIPIIAHLSANLFHYLMEWLYMPLDYSRYTSFVYFSALVLVSALIFSAIVIRRKWRRDGFV